MPGLHAGTGSGTCLRGLVFFKEHLAKEALIWKFFGLVEVLTLSLLLHFVQVESNSHDFWWKPIPPKGPSLSGPGGIKLHVICLKPCNVPPKDPPKLTSHSENRAVAVKGAICT